MAIGTKRILWFIAIVAVLIVLSAIFYLYIRKQNQESQSALISAYNNGLAAKRTGDYEKAITELLPVASQKNYDFITLQAEFAVAWSKFSRNALNDRAEAISTFKKIAEDELASSCSRASAYNNLALTFLNRDYNLMRTEVFKGEPYESYLNFAQEGNYFPAIRQLALSADSLCPNGLSKVVIALSYASPLNDGITSPGKDKRETAEFALKYLNDAKLLMTETKILEPVLSGSAWLIYSSAISMLNEALNNINIKEITSGYENVFSIEKTGGPDVFFGSLDLVTRLFYAMTLYYYASDGEKNYSNKIRDLLLPFSEVNKSDPEYFSVREFVKNIMIEKYPDHLQKRFRVLASISPEFKNFLESVSR